MKKIAIAIIILAISSAAIGQGKSKKVTLKTAQDSLSYSFGLLIGNNMMVQGVEQLNMDLFLSGFENGYADQQELLQFTEANQYVQDYFNKKTVNESTMNAEKSKAFLEENKTKEGVITTASGLQYKELTAGTGDSPKPGDQVKVHYHGTFIDGKVFDSSIDRGEPIVFGVNQVIAGWTEALQLMKPGSRWMLYIPSNLAYGEQGAGGVIGPNQALIFEVELIEVIPQF